MSPDTFLKIKGEKQEEIKDAATQKRREGSILVNAVGHTVALPRDIASRLPDLCTNP